MGLHLAISASWALNGYGLFCGGDHLADLIFSSDPSSHGGHSSEPSRTASFSFRSDVVGVSHLE